MSAEDRNTVIEEVARFVETHWCEWRFDLKDYIVHPRSAHPKEPLAAAIRGLKQS